MRMLFELNGSMPIEVLNRWQATFLDKCVQLADDTSTVDIVCESQNEWVIESARALNNDTVGGLLHC